MAERVGRVNWVQCPKCSYQYYIGPQFFMVEEKAQAVCPKCRKEFDPRQNLRAKLTSMAASERWF